MLKRTLMMMIGLFGAASMAVAGAPITTMTTSPWFQSPSGQVTGFRISKPLDAVDTNGMKLCLVYQIELDRNFGCENLTSLPFSTPSSAN